MTAIVMVQDGDACDDRQRASDGTTSGFWKEEKPSRRLGRKASASFTSDSSRGAQL